MSPLHAEYQSAEADAVARTKAAENLRRDDPVGVSTSTWMCLVLSLDPERRRRLIDITEEAGWRAVSCDSVSEAVRRSERWKTHLAVLDLLGVSGVSRQAVRDFASRLATHPEPLLMVCDGASNDDELWARKLGVWLYLPSATLGDDLVDFCSEALTATEKQQAALAGIAAKAAQR